MRDREVVAVLVESHEVSQALAHLDGVLCTDHLEDNKGIAMREEWEERYRTPGIGM